MRIDIVAEGHFSQIVLVEGDEQAAKKSSDRNAAGSLIGREVVALALGIVELLLARLHVYVGVREFAKVNFGPRHAYALHRALHGHIAQDQSRQAFGGEAIHRVHGDAVAMGVDELLIDPVAAAFRQLIDVEFSGGEHHLAYIAVDLISINVDVRKIVIGSDLLNLPQRVLQGMPIPQANILERRLVVGRIGGFYCCFRREFSL